MSATSITGMVGPGEEPQCAACSTACSDHSPLFRSFFGVGMWMPNSYIQLHTAIVLQFLVDSRAETDRGKTPLNSATGAHADLKDFSGGRLGCQRLQLGSIACLTAGFPGCRSSSKAGTLSPHRITSSINSTNDLTFSLFSSIFSTCFYLFRGGSLRGES